MIEYGNKLNQSYVISILKVINKFYKFINK